MLDLDAQLDALARAHGAWVRLHYVYPYPHVDDVVAADGRTPWSGGCSPTSTCRSSTRTRIVLKRMKRPASGEKEPRARPRWREDAAPEIVMRSTFIAGFPGETECRVRGSARRSCAKRRSTAPAASPIRRSRARPPTTCPVAVAAAKLREERRARFMAVADISAARLSAKVGQTLDVLVDAVEGGIAIARSAADAPEIDGVVRVRRGCRRGTRRSSRGCSVTGSDAHDLDAELTLTPTLSHLVGERAHPLTPALSRTRERESSDSEAGEVLAPVSAPAARSGDQSGTAGLQHAADLPAGRRPDLGALLWFVIGLRRQPGGAGRDWGAGCDGGWRRLPCSWGVGGG